MTTGTPQSQAIQASNSLIGVAQQIMNIYDQIGTLGAQWSDQTVATTLAAFGTVATTPDGGVGPPDPAPVNGHMIDLKTYPHKLVYESNRDGNFKLYMCSADGSGTVALTKSKDVDELYPKPSPDGTKICFVADEGKGADKIRNVYYMNSDGSGRVKIAANGREPCWSPDGTHLAASGFFGDQVAAVWSAQGKLLKAFSRADLGIKDATPTGVIGNRPF